MSEITIRSIAGEMMNLYYIGNGFDLAHGLRTAYLDFKEYLKKHYPNFYERFLELYDLRANLHTDFTGEELLYDEDDESIIELWQDFENTLAKISFSFVDNKLDDLVQVADLTKCEFEGILDPDPS